MLSISALFAPSQGPRFGLEMGDNAVRTLESEIHNL